MHTLLLLLQLSALTVGVVAVLSIVGFGCTALLTKDLSDFFLLLSPFIGLAILYWVCQILSRWYASTWIVVGSFLVTGLFSLFILWTRRESLRIRIAGMRRDAAIASLLAFVSTILLQLPMLHTGAFTLADFSGDDIFTWAPTAAYMRDHAFAIGHPTAYVSPLLWLLPTNIYDGSAGTVDGGLAALFRMQTFRFVEPLSAVCLGLGVAGVYLLARAIVPSARGVAVFAAILAATSQARFVTSGFGFAQSTRGAVLMIGTLVLFIAAMNERRVPSAVGAGAMGAVLTAVYMPAFLVLGAAFVGGIVSYAATASRNRRWSDARRTLVGFFAAALVAGAGNLYWLLGQGGLHAWYLQRLYGTGLFFLKYPWNYLAGMAPVQALYRSEDVLPFSTTKPFIWNDVWTTASFFVAAAVVLLGLLGVAAMGWRNRLATYSMVAVFAYSALAFAINHGGFGSFQSVLYVTPLACIPVALGARSAATRAAGLIDRLVAHRATLRPDDAAGRSGWVPVWSVLFAALAVALVGFQSVVTADTEAFFVNQPGTVPLEALKVEHIAALIPKGSTVLMYSPDGSNDAITVRKTDVLVAAASFLPDREITIEGRFFYSSYGASDAAVILGLIALQYTYILHYGDPGIDDPKVPAGYRAIWHFVPYHLTLYRREQ